MKKHFFCQDCNKEFEANSDQCCPHCKSVRKHVELKPFVYFIGGSEYRWNKPSYGSVWSILWSVKLESASDEVWDMASEEAANYDQESDVCECCNGLGCEDCDFEGEIYEEWSEHVQRHVHYGVEEYDSKVHYKIPSEFPEYLKYKKETDIEMATSQYKRRLADIKKLERLLVEARKDAKDAKVNLNKFLEHYGEELVK